jgi:hypothetical protein
MVIEQINQILLDVVSVVFTGYETEMLSLALYTVGIALYGIIIWNFYRHLAKKDIFSTDFSKYKAMHGGVTFVKKFLSSFFYILKYLVIFPLYTFLWFGILSGFLFLLAKTQTVENILLISITIVSAIRLTSYYSEDLSKDLAKMIPFALLGIFVVDPSFFSISLVYERFLELPSLINVIVRYLLFVVVLEFGLKIVTGFIRFLATLFRKGPKADLPKTTKKNIPAGTVPIAPEDQ